MMARFLYPLLYCICWRWRYVLQGKKYTAVAWKIDSTWKRELYYYRCKYVRGGKTIHICCGSALVNISSNLLPAWGAPPRIYPSYQQDEVVFISRTKLASSTTWQNHRKPKIGATGAAFPRRIPAVLPQLLHSFPLKPSSGSVEITITGSSYWRIWLGLWRHRK